MFVTLWISYPPSYVSAGLLFIFFFWRNSISFCKSSGVSNLNRIAKGSSSDLVRSDTINSFFVDNRGWHLLLEWLLRLITVKYITKFGVVMEINFECSMKFDWLDYTKNTLTSLCLEAHSPIATPNYYCRYALTYTHSFIIHSNPLDSFKQFFE